MECAQGSIPARAARSSPGQHLGRRQGGRNRSQDLPPADQQVPPALSPGRRRPTGAPCPVEPPPSPANLATRRGGRLAGALHHHLPEETRLCSNDRDLTRPSPNTRVSAVRRMLASDGDRLAARCSARRAAEAPALPIADTSEAQALVGVSRGVSRRRPAVTSDRHRRPSPPRLVRPFVDTIAERGPTASTWW